MKSTGLKEEPAIIKAIESNNELAERMFWNSFVKSTNKTRPKKWIHASFLTLFLLWLLYSSFDPHIKGWTISNLILGIYKLFSKISETKSRDFPTVFWCVFAENNRYQKVMHLAFLPFTCQVLNKFNSVLKFSMKKWFLWHVWRCRWKS